MAVTKYNDKGDFDAFAQACPELVCLSHENIVKVFGMCSEGAASVTEVRFARCNTRFGQPNIAVHGRV